MNEGDKDSKKKSKEVWCQVKSSDNSGGRKWQDCQKCCSFCNKVCDLRVCKDSQETYVKDALCCWRASPAEWLMGRLERKAMTFIYNRRMYENYLKRGVRPSDGTWEGDRLKDFWKKYPKVYQEIFEEFAK